MTGDVTMSGVPLAVWQTRSFQQWYAAQVAAGNALLNAQEEWAFNGGPGDELPFFWALRVSIHVTAENRIKSNEIVISRPDISVVALYRRAATLDEAIVVLIREFRSPAATPDGFVHELPGGSGPGDALAQAVSEVAEETGLAIDAARLAVRGSRQVAATLSAHHAHLFAAELTEEELASLRTEQAQPQPHGAGDSERTWIEITTFGEMRARRLVDWATLGMIADVLLGATGGAAPQDG